MGIDNGLLLTQDSSPQYVAWSFLFLTVWSHLQFHCKLNFLYQVGGAWTCTCGGWRGRMDPLYPLKLSTPLHPCCILNDLLEVSTYGFEITIDNTEFRLATRPLHCTLGFHNNRGKLNKLIWSEKLLPFCFYCLFCQHLPTNFLEEFAWHKSGHRWCPGSGAPRVKLFSSMGNFRALKCYT